MVTYFFPLANNGGFRAELVHGGGFVKEVNLIGDLDVQRIANYNLPKQIQGQKIDRAVTDQSVKQIKAAGK